MLYFYFKSVCGCDISRCVTIQIKVNDLVLYKGGLLGEWLVDKTLIS